MKEKVPQAEEKIVLMTTKDGKLWGAINAQILERYYTKRERERLSFRVIYNDFSIHSTNNK